MQSALFSENEFDRIVNVAVVPQRSPFRYPGGKTWLVPRIRRWIASLPALPKEFIEPFAGGGIVGLTVAFEGLADHVTLIERDEQVAAVWETMLNGGAARLAARIRQFDLTPETAQAELCRENPTTEQRAFQTILRNRINHGGILAPGSGTLNKGENGRGIKSRWYPDTLANRILAIESVKEKIRFVAGDGLRSICEKADCADAAFFLDPPYTVAGKKAGNRLYTHFNLDHEALFAMAAKIRGSFLMTYDNAEGVHALAQTYGFDTQTISMKNTHHAEMTELLIGRNLEWAR